MGRTEWIGEHDFTLDGVRYRSMVPGTGTKDLFVYKPRDLVELYEGLVASAQPRTILELGIYRGGGAALLAQLAQPDKLVALDIDEGPCERLEKFIDAHVLRGTLVPYYGIDQANTDQLDTIMAAEFSGPIDLVIDDASHFEAQSRASFNRLFPHVRPGGLYIIEDWAWAHSGLVTDPIFQGIRPLSYLVSELVLAAACRPKAIAEVTVGYHWATVRRGTADLYPERFDLSAVFDPVGRAMVEGMAEVRSLRPD